MPTEREQIESTIAGLEAQRALLGDAMVDAALVRLREKLATLTATAPLERPSQILKQVTILFLDIVGSTALSQRLDPEETGEVMDGALARFARIVEQYGGKVLRYAGDNVLAVFGADLAREDDPERAVRAGLALLEEARREGKRVQSQYGHVGFNVRAGLHTGGVLLGGGVDAEGGIRGMAVNVAARMEQTAPPGALRISHETYRHVRGLFDVEAQPPLAVKGLNEPVATYLALRAKPRAFRVAGRGIEGVETRMIGRDRELCVLQDAFGGLFSDGSLTTITVVAEAGLGKSRLLYEFRNWAEARPEPFKLFLGRASPPMVSQPYALLRDILVWRLEIAEGDSAAAAKRKLEDGLAPIFASDEGDDTAQAHVHFLGHLIGFDFSASRHVKAILDNPRQVRDRGFQSAAHWFRRIAQQDGMPIVLLLEDLHWADDGSLDFLAHLAQVNRDVPMLMLGLTRPVLFQRRADWGHAEGALHQRIDLGPLDQVSKHLLANELLKKLGEVPAGLSELIVGRAEGNPFYMEELVKMLVDEGAIRTDEETWVFEPDRLRATHVPQTLTGVLQARLDTLKPAAKLALQQASVIGIVFWGQALAAIDAQAMAELPSLVRHGLVSLRQEAEHADLREYAFGHQILHQVTYDTLLKPARRECHAKVAAWFAAESNAHPGQFLGVAARHYEKAGDSISALEFYVRSAEHAAGRFAHETAIREVTGALALIESDAALGAPLVCWRLLDVRERMLDLKGQRAEQLGDLDALQALAEALGDDRRRGVVQWRRCDLAFRTGDYRTQERAARQAMALAERAGDEALRLNAQRRLAMAMATLGDTAAGQELAREGLASAQASGLRQAEAQFYNALSVISELRGDVVAMLEADQRQLAIICELGDRRTEAINRVNVGLSWLNLGQHPQAREYLEQGLRLTRAVGDRAQEPFALVGLSILALWQGAADRALMHARSAFETAVAVKDPLQEATALCWLANAELALGHYDAAASAFEKARTAAIEIGHPQQHDATAGLARVALARGDLERALVAVQCLSDHLTRGGTLEGTEAPLNIELSCHDVLSRAGDARAAAVLARAHRALEARAATISDAALRESFLHNVPDHHAIVAAWAAQQSAPAVRQQQVGST